MGCGPSPHAGANLCDFYRELLVRLAPYGRGDARARGRAVG
jgi:hypothetical protein